MASAANVFPRTEENLPRSLFGKPKSRSYRAACKQIVLDVQARQRLSDQELADIIGCHKDTIQNVKEEACDLSAVTLLIIAYAFGEESIRPVRELYLCKPAEQPTALSEIEKARQALNAAEKIITERDL